MKCWPEANATNRLVHSGSECGATKALGACKIITQNKNINPISMVDKFARTFIIILIAVSKKATPIK